MSKFWRVSKSNLPQITINKPVSVSGNAFRWFSSKSKIVFLSSDKQGVLFKIGNKIIEPTPQNLVFDEKHCTTLKSGSAKVMETEHVLSAVYGLGITNLVIEIIGCDEPPIMDGSSKEFVDALLKAGIKRLKEKRQETQITKKFKFTLPGSDSFIKVEPYDGFIVNTKVSYLEPIGDQKLSLEVTPKKYREEIAFARPPLRCSIEGAPIESLREWFKGYEKNKKSFIYYSKDKYLTKLRIEDEVVRHKTLDFIGDQKKAMKNLTWKDMNKKNNLMLLDVSSEEKLIDKKKEIKREQEMLKNIKKKLGTGNTLIITGCGHLNFFERNLKNAIFPLR